jgi:G3E family GTPase
MRPLVTALTGPSATLRAQLARCLVLRRPGLVAVHWTLDPAPEGPVLRTVVDARGTHDSTRLAGCCVSCAVRADAPEVLGLLGDRWSEVLLVLPTPVRADALDGLPVDRVATAVDAVLLRSQLTGADLLADRGLAAAATDRRSTAELVVGHVEDADVVAVAGLPRLATAAARTTSALLSHLAPLAAQVVVAPGGEGCEDLLAAGPADRAPAGERLEAAALAAQLCPPACDVASAVWTADRPLHPGRLSDALPDLVRGLVRSRGHLWLAGRETQRLRWEQAGGSVQLGAPARWDRLPSSALVLTGLGVEPARVVAAFDACLATDRELVAGAFPDPFADVLGPAVRR